MIICQVTDYLTPEITCSHMESGGYYCEARGEHDKHFVGLHTITHNFHGNSYTCQQIEDWISNESLAAQPRPRLRG